MLGLGRIPIKLDGDSPWGKSGQTVHLEFDGSRHAPLFLADGTKVMLDVGVDDVHDPTELPSYLAGYAVPNHRAEQFCPVLQVDAEKGKLRNHTLDDAFVMADVDMAAEDTVKQVSFETALVDYTCRWRGIGSFVGQAMADQALPTATGLNPGRAASRRCMRIMSMDRENRVSTYYVTNTNWAAAQRITLGSTLKWDTGAASNPIKDLQDGIELATQPVTDIVMPQRIAHKFVTHPLVKDYAQSFLGGNRGLEEAVGNLAGAASVDVDIKLPSLPPIRVSASKYKNTAGGLTYFWGNAVVGLCLQDRMPTDGESINTAIMPRLRGPSGVGLEVSTIPVTAAVRGVRGGTMHIVVGCETIFASASSAGFHIASPFASF